ncbi:MAG: hypothetical protein ABIC39_05520 [Pseudomonadota bacterium]
MKKFPELHRHEFEQFLEKFSRRGTLKFRNNKWIGLTRDGKPFTVHVKHGTTRKYSSRLVEAVAKDLSVTPEEFQDWYK